MKSYQFPSFNETFPKVAHKKTKKFKFILRTKAFFMWIVKFEHFVNSDVFYQQLFADPKSSYNLLRVYVDCRFSISKRYSVLLHESTFAKENFCHDLLKGISIPLVQDIEVEFNRNTLSPREGMWSVCLNYQQSQETICVYRATFCLLPKGILLIGSIQGCSHEDAKQLIKKTTKAMYGLRPQQFIIWLLQVFAHSLEYRLAGISLKNYSNVRLRHRLGIDTLFDADYDKIWQDYAGELNVDGYYHFPDTMPRKALSDITAKKRSMYRKRYALLDEIQQQISSTVLKG